MMQNLHTCTFFIIIFLFTHANFKHFIWVSMSIILNLLSSGGKHIVLLFILSVLPSRMYWNDTLSRYFRVPCCGEGKTESRYTSWEKASDLIMVTFPNMVKFRSRQMFSTVPILETLSGILRFAISFLFAEILTPNIFIGSFVHFTFISGAIFMSEPFSAHNPRSVVVSKFIFNPD